MFLERNNLDVPDSKYIEVLDDKQLVIASYTIKRIDDHYILARVFITNSVIVVKRLHPELSKIVAVQNVLTLLLSELGGVDGILYNREYSGFKRLELI